MKLSMKRRVAAAAYLAVFAALVGWMSRHGADSATYWAASGFLTGVGLALGATVYSGRWRAVACLQGILFLGGGVLYLAVVTRGADPGPVRLLLGGAWTAVGVWGVFRGVTRPFDALRPEWAAESGDGTGDVPNE